MVYNEYAYLYPPRPEHKIKAASLNTYDNGQYVAQPKYNGSCCIIFMNRETGFLKITNRHREDITNIKMVDMDFMGAHQGTGFMVLTGELLNKSKTGEDGKVFNQKYIIWDILVYNGVYLIGTTTSQRLTLLEELYPCHRMVVDGKLEAYDHLCTTKYKGIYRAPAYTKYFNSLYNDLVKTDVYEGLVLKRLDAKLALGFAEKNNTNWQIKVRKETKNYSF